MKTLLTSLLAICVSITTFSAFATERIEGAFGKKLGDVFEPTSAIGTSKLKDGVLMYEFATTNGFRSFKHYYVMITPTTHKIYKIRGTGGVESTSVGRKEQSIMMGVLREKYGSEFRIGPLDSMGDVKRISQGSRHIVTTLVSLSDVTLNIEYYDEDLEKVAEKEKLAEETATIDKSGL